MATYLTEEERQAQREKQKAEKMAADDRIRLLTKQKEDDASKLRDARKAKKEAEDKAKLATVEANKKSATYAMVQPEFVVIPGAPIVGSITAAADGRVGSKEDVVSLVTAGVSLVATIGCALTGNPTAALVFATATAGATGAALTRRSRAAGEKMRAEALAAAEKKKSETRAAG